MQNALTEAGLLAGEIICYCTHSFSPIKDNDASGTQESDIAALPVVSIELHTMQLFFSSPGDPQCNYSIYIHCLLAALNVLK